MNEYVQKKIIFWTFALVLGLGLIEIKLFLIPPTTVAHAQSIASKMRAPASLASPQTSLQNNIVLDEANEILDFQIPCHKKETDISAAGSRQIRFHFANCQDGELKLLAIVNETNAYDATIFDLGDSQQTSDFIPLKEGANRFKVSFIDSDEQKSEAQYVFNRPVTKVPQK